ncbi:hypothetical protein RJ640_003106 [Escallonia rubra]|uniref:Uncharacterized protein n=1 Tax=Escallonia rubra TaxID=112253 RepID=A0AA88QGM7_9ASTE|nr:hypothetical protein RJ640_003106 [Escallonia rubra]
MPALVCASSDKKKVAVNGGLEELHLSTDRDGPIGPDSGFELDESDVWNSVGGVVVSPDYRKPVVSSRKKLLAAAKRAEAVVGWTTSSLPVNIPDWAKILKEDYKTTGTGTATMMGTARISRRAAIGCHRMSSWRGSSRGRGWPPSRCTKGLGGPSRGGI